MFNGIILTDGAVFLCSPRLKGLQRVRLATLFEAHFIINVDRPNSPLCAHVTPLPHSFVSAAS